MMRAGRFTSRRGFTIVEASIATLLVGVLLASSLSAIGAMARSQRIQAERRAAYALCKQLMAEVMSSCFADPDQTPSIGAESGEISRALFDDVDDYDGYSNSPPLAKDGTVLSGYSGWTRSVSVVSVSPAAPDTALAGSSLKKITVTVKSPTGKTVSMSGWRSPYSPYEATVYQSTNYVTSVGVEVKVGTATTPIRTAVRPLNETSPQ